MAAYTLVSVLISSFEANRRRFAPQDDAPLWISYLWTPSPKPFSTPLDQLAADFFGFFLLRPMAAVFHQIFLEVGNELLHAVGGRRRQPGVVLGHDHQRRHLHQMIEVDRALPVARKIA